MIQAKLMYDYLKRDFMLTLLCN